MPRHTLGLASVAWRVRRDFSEQSELERVLDDLRESRVFSPAESTSEPATELVYTVDSHENNLRVQHPEEGTLTIVGSYDGSCYDQVMEILPEIFACFEYGVLTDYTATLQFSDSYDTFSDLPGKLPEQEETEVTGVIVTPSDPDFKFVFDGADSTTSITATLTEETTIRDPTTTFQNHQEEIQSYIIGCLPENIVGPQPQ